VLEAPMSTYFIAFDYLKGHEGPRGITKICHLQHIAET